MGTALAPFGLSPMDDLYRARIEFARMMHGVSPRRILYLALSTSALSASIDLASEGLSISRFVFIDASPQPVPPESGECETVGFPPSLEELSHSIAVRLGMGGYDAVVVDSADGLANLFGEEKAELFCEYLVLKAYVLGIRAYALSTDDGASRLSRPKLV